MELNWPGFKLFSEFIEIKIIGEALRLLLIAEKNLFFLVTSSCH